MTPRRGIPQGRPFTAISAIVFTKWNMWPVKCTGAYLTVAHKIAQKPLNQKQERSIPGADDMSNAATVARGSVSCATCSCTMLYSTGNAPPISYGVSGLRFFPKSFKKFNEFKEKGVSNL